MGKKMNGVDIARGENCVKGGECGKHELEIVLDLQETTDKMYLWHRMSDATRRKKKWRIILLVVTDVVDGSIEENRMEMR